MANEEHLAILKKGVEAWNEWREKNPDIIPDLNYSDLRFIDLSDINLSGAELQNARFNRSRLAFADLDEADLRTADFTQTDVRFSNFHLADLRDSSFRGADLFQSDLTGADLTGADLSRANLSESILNRTIFTDAKFTNTNIVDVDLSQAIDLEGTRHFGPSSIGVDTFYKSNGKIPDKFLRDAGVPDNFITYMSSLTGKAFEYYSCFISYTEADDVFSKRLYEGLQAAGLRVWRWREDAKWGAPIEKNIDQAVRIYDKLIVICSKDSLKAPAVIDEIDRAFQKEHALMKDGKVPEVLFPITIDDYIFDEWGHYLKPKVMAKTVGDFRGWEDPRKYDAVLQRLIDALKQE